MDLTKYLEINEDGVAISGIHNAYDGNPPSNWIVLPDDDTNGITIGWTWTGTEWVDNRDYDVKRLREYPSMAEQLDMMYHDQVNGTTTWKDAITTIKENNPKP